MLLEHIRDLSLLFFGGKGGVGKTTMAAATAVHYALNGEKVLLISTDPAHNVGHLFQEQIGDSGAQLHENLDVIEIDAHATTAEHLAQVEATMKRLSAPRLHKEIQRHVRLAAEAPGTFEAALLERIAQLVTTHYHTHQRIIVDTAPSGHTARLLALPELMNAWTEGLLQRREKSDRLSAIARGMSAKDSAVRTAQSPLEKRNQELRSILSARQQHFAQFRDILHHQGACGFIIVLTAEALPVAETLEFYHELTAHQHLNVPALIVNRRSPQDQGDFLARRHELENKHLHHLTQNLPEVPVVEIPLHAEDLTGFAALRTLGRDYLAP